MSIKDQLRAAILSGGATGASPSGEDTSALNLCFGGASYE